VSVQFGVPAMSPRAYVRRPGLVLASQSLFEALALEGGPSGHHKSAREQVKKVLFNALVIDGAVFVCHHPSTAAAPVPAGTLKRNSSGTKASALRADAPEFVPRSAMAGSKMPVLPEIEQKAEEPIPELPSPDEQADRVKVEQPMPEVPSPDEQALPAALSCDTSHQDWSSCGSSVSITSDSGTATTATTAGQDSEVAGAGPELASILRLRHALTEKRLLRQCSFDDSDFDGIGGFGGTMGYPETEVQPLEKWQPLSQRSMFTRLNSKLKAQSCCHGGS